MATKNIVPRATGEGSLGTSEKKWGNIYADNITLVDGETLDTKISSIKDTADTAYTTATEAEASITTSLANYLPLAGGVMTGTLYSSYTNTLRYQGEFCSIYNNTTANGAGLLLRSKDSSTNAGGFEITARDGTNALSLKGTSHGALTWNGNKLITKADLITSTISATMNIAIGAYGLITASASLSGYTPIGVVGTRTSGTNSTYACLLRSYLTDSTLTANIRNLSSSGAIDGTVYWTVLYVAN